MCTCASAACGGRYPEGGAEELYNPEAAGQAEGMDDTALMVSCLGEQEKQQLMQALKVRRP